MWRIAMVGVFLVLLQAQDHPSIEIGEDRLLSAGGPALPLAELQLSANPKKCETSACLRDSILASRSKQWEICGIGVTLRRSTHDSLGTPSSKAVGSGGTTP